MPGRMKLTMGMRTLFGALVDDGLSLEVAGRARRSRNRLKYRARGGNGRVSDLIDETTVDAAVRRGFLDRTTLTVTPAGQKAWRMQE